AAAHGANEAMCGEQLSVIGRRILRTAIRVVNAALRRIAFADRRLKRRDRQTRIDRAADRIAHHPARPPIEDHGQVHKARLDRDVGYVRDPELIGTIDLLVASEIGKNRTLVIAVGRDDVPSAALGLQAVLAHEPADLLAVDDKTLVAQLGADPPTAVSLELVADNDDFRDEFHVAYRYGRRIIESGARQSHQTASFVGGMTLGPLMTDWRGSVFSWAGDAASSAEGIGAESEGARGLTARA